jgi:hypothetical protein
MKIALRVTWVVLFLAAVPAWAGSTTFTGAVSNDCDAPGAGNWSNNYPYQNETIIDNTGPYSNLTDVNGYVSPNYLTLNRDGGATFDRLGTLRPDETGAVLGTGITVKNAATYTITGSIDTWMSPTTRFDVALGGVLNIGVVGGVQGAITFAGPGATNIGDWHSYGTPATWTLESAPTVSVSYVNAYGGQSITAVTGTAGTVNLTGNWAFRANNYNFGGQLVLRAGDHAFAKFVNADGSLASTVTGVNINLAGRNGANALLVGGGDQTFVHSTITGDGNIFCNSVVTTSNNYGYGPFTTMTAKGCTIAPSNSGVAGTNAFGGTASNGQMVVMGNLVLDKDASDKKTQLVFAVTGTGGQLGADYTQLSIQYGGTINSASNIAAGGTNPLADADLVVNITKGLNNTALVGQTLKILEVNSTDLRTSTFGVTVVGGTATVTPMHVDAHWYPAWDDPNRVFVDAANWLELSNIVSAPLAIPGDADGSGLVDQDDYKIWYDNYGTGTTWKQGNFKGYGLTDQDDYKTWYDNYGAGKAGGAVPEPATMALLAMGALGLIRRKK